MPNNFASTTYVFNGNVSQPANAALGVFSAQAYSTAYGTGGNDTTAIQAAINAASVSGGVAFLPPPVSGTLYVGRGADGLAQALYLPSNVWLVGAEPGILVSVIGGSNLDWIIANGVYGAINPATNFAVNYRSVTLGGNTYTVYDPSRPADITTGGGIINVTFVGQTGDTGQGNGILLNGARYFSLQNVSALSCNGEELSVWDCVGLTAQGGNLSTPNVGVAVHRACYDTSVISYDVTSSANVTPYRVYTEQFQVPSGPLLTLSPMFTKLVDSHSWSSVTQPESIDLQGAVYVNMTSDTADNATTLFAAATRYGAPCYNVLSDVGAISGVSSVSVTAPITNSGTSTNPNIGLNGGNPLPVANGGTGTNSPSLVQGTNITITGTWPNQTINATASTFPFTVVQEAAVSPSSNTSSVTVTFEQAAAASGNTLFIVVAADVAPTITVSGYTAVASKGQSSFAQVAVFKKASAGDTSATVTLSTSNPSVIYFFEVVGTRALDQSATLGIGTPSNTFQGSAITPTSGSMVFFFGCYIPDLSNVPVAINKLAYKTWTDISIVSAQGSGGRALIGAVYNGSGAGSSIKPPIYSFVSPNYSGAAVALLTMSIL